MLDIQTGLWIHIDSNSVYYITLDPKNWMIVSNLVFGDGLKFIDWLDSLATKLFGFARKGSGIQSTNGCVHHKIGR